MYNEGSEENTGGWNFKRQFLSIYDSAWALFSEYFACIAFFFIAAFVGMIVIFSILAMCKTCCFRSNVTCCHVTYLSLKLFILVPLWFLRYFKFLDEEKKQFDVVESFHMKNVLRRQPLHDYYEVPTPNHFVEHEK